MRTGLNLTGFRRRVIRLCQECGFASLTHVLLQASQTLNSSTGLCGVKPAQSSQRLVYKLYMLLHGMLWQDLANRRGGIYALNSLMAEAKYKTRSTDSGDALNGNVMRRPLEEARQTLSCLLQRLEEYKKAAD